MIDAILSRLDGVREAPGRLRWLARCPCKSNHRNGDRNRSFVVWGDERRGVVRCYCYKGCRFDEIEAAVGLERSDWSLRGGSNRPSRERGPKVEFDEVYEYRDQSGNLRYEVCRTPDKSFPTRRPVQLEQRQIWAWGLTAGWYDNREGRRPITGEIWLRKDGLEKGVWLEDEPRLPYRLPELMAANPKAPVMIAEGEKDVERLRSLGFIATCNSGGAGHWVYSSGVYLAGRRVVIWPDLDPAGSKHAAMVAGMLMMCGVGEVRIACASEGYLPPPGGKDVSDWLDVVEDEHAAVVSVCKRLRVYSLTGNADRPTVRTEPVRRSPVVA
jgi:putative DNA primase/helicase